jgi:DNA-binding MarR family transcriptional regulator
MRAPLHIHLCFESTAHAHALGTHSCVGSVDCAVVVGAWVKDIRKRTKLTAQQVQKSLKTLVLRKLIKTQRSMQVGHTRSLLYAFT